MEGKLECWGKREARVFGRKARVFGETRVLGGSGKLEYLEGKPGVLGEAGSSSIWKESWSVGGSGKLEFLEGKLEYLGKLEY